MMNILMVSEKKLMRKKGMDFCRASAVTWSSLNVSVIRYVSAGRAVSRSFFKVSAETPWEGLMRISLYPSV